jgi:hypothetical protein
MSEEDRAILMDYVKDVRDLGYVDTNKAMLAISVLALLALEKKDGTQE